MFIGFKGDILQLGDIFLLAIYAMNFFQVLIYESFICNILRLLYYGEL